jgi:trimeric autotransporter adhesin
MPRNHLSSRRTRLLLALALGLGSSLAQAAEPKQALTPLDQKAFFKPDLYISSSQLPLEDVVGRLPNRAAWEGFAADARSGWASPADVKVWIDPRSGAATNLLGAYPLIPGDGFGNQITGKPAEAADVEQAVRRFLRQHAPLLGIDPAQLGQPRVSQVTEELWQVRFPQAYQGLPVRHGHLVATISHGNLVLVGTESWGNVRDLGVVPAVTAEQALQTGFAFADGPTLEDVLLQPAQLEVVPFAPAQLQQGEAFAGDIGAGYGHRLVWSFVFQRAPEGARWQVSVDAHTGEVLALEDTNHYVQQPFTGGAYPLTSTEICNVISQCGTMQANSPMPFADTGLPSPNNFTNSAGIVNWTSGTVTTTLTGQFVDIVDTCGAINASSPTGAIALGGTNGQHDCTVGAPSTGAGNTPASRSAFYELNKLKEQARGWLPTNSWLQARLTTNVNLNQTCNAFWNGSSVNFYRSGGGCRNTGEIAAVFDHEWGHGMDDNDAGGSLSNSSEGYADIAAIYRLQASCVGHGFFSTAGGGCGRTLDNTGNNQNEAQQGAAHCDTDCSGVRDADYLKHNPNTPDTALGFVCTSCIAGSGPCGRQVHCAAAPSRQAAWDFAARDLQAAPFNLDSQSAFIVANRTFYVGSGSIGSWHSCTCGGTSSGCGATNGYMQWLAADDNDGNVNNGTPHMTALFAAFNRHGIACATPTPVNSGCAGGPTAAPSLSGTGGSFSASLSWNTVAGATRYQVFRSEGPGGCNFGKTKIAETTGTTFTDTQVANGRSYFYNVVAAGASNACYGRASNCVTVVPNGTAAPDFGVSCSPTTISVAQGGSATSSCTVTSSNGFNSAVALSCTGLANGLSCAFNPASVTPPANGNATSTLTLSAPTAATGTTTFSVQGVGGALTRNQAMTAIVTGGGATDVFFDNFETNLGWTRNFNNTDTATTGLWERGDPEQTTSGVVTQLGTTVSGVNNLVTARLAGASAGANDVDGGTTSITSPPIALPATGTLTLSFSYYMAHLTNSSSADFLRVSVVGTTTTQVFQEVGAANNDAAAFATATVNISAFAGQTVRIRIEAADAATASLVEAAVDDVRITRQ